MNRLKIRAMNNLDFEERESYKQLKSWLIELKNRSDKV